MIQRCLLVGVMAFAIVSCSDSTGPAVPKALEFSVPNSIVMTAGASDTVAIVVRDGSGHALNAMPIVWTSSNEAIVRVDSGGVLTADSAGTATITAWLDTLHASFDVTVVQTIESLVVEPADTVFQMFQSIPLRVKALDQTGRNVSVNPEQLSFSTSDSLVLVVDSAGTVTGRGWGSARITVQVDSISASITLHSAPKEIDLGGTQLASVDVGLRFYCGKDVAGDLYCWGENKQGQLGIDDTSSFVALPTKVQTDLSFVQFGAGQLHACGLTATGEMWCWGNNGRAALGLGYTGADSRVPVEVSGGHVWRSLAVGEHDATCGTTDADIPYCWGHNDFFQVGRTPNSQVDSLVAPVSGGFQMTAIDLDVAGACGLSTTGHPLCWAQDHPMGTHALPREVASPQLVSLWVGNASPNCGLTSAGEAWCWGYTSGVLGIPDNSVTESADAIRVTTTLRFTKLAIRNAGVCGITLSGDLHCWGPGSPLPDDSPAMGEPGTKFLDINSASSSHTLCAITTEHRMYCW